MSVPACETWHLLLQADLDGELEPGRAAELATHLAGCPACTELQQNLAATSARIRRDASRHQAPAALRGFATRQRATPTRFRAPRFWPGVGAGLAIAAALALIFIPREPADITGQIIDAHARALQPGHLLDVASTDRHTVKPWFAGRIDFSPPVRDLAAQGFPLKGGRLDIIAGHPAAALIYTHGPHTIDVLIWPEPGCATQPQFGTHRGYLYATWRQDGMAFWAVSDMASNELQRFANLLR